MERTYLVTQDNLIGSIATAMLKLKKIKGNRSPSNDIHSFIELIKFIDAANESNYKDLLYDKNFFVSESVLNNLHEDLQEKKVSSIIDFKELINILTKIIEKAIPEEIDFAMDKLKEVVNILLQIKGSKHIYM